MATITEARIQTALNLPPAEALAFLFGKESAIYQSLKNVPADILRVVFTVSGVLAMDVLLQIREIVQKSLEEGLSFEEFKQSLSGNDAVAKILPTSRLQTIYRTNLQSAFMAARWRQQVEIVERKPFWQAIAVMDGSTTQGCRDLDQKVFRYDDPIWNTNYPPRHYGCRLRVRALNARELERYGGTVEEGTNYDHIQPDPHFATTPDVPFQPVNEDYPADIWEQYENRQTP